jgi:hypothetical protein
MAHNRLPYSHPRHLSISPIMARKFATLILKNGAKRLELGDDSQFRLATVANGLPARRFLRRVQRGGNHWIPRCHPDL